MPLAELHCHIEGAALPELVRELAHRNDQDITGLIDEDGGYVWTDFDDFLSAYDKAASVFTRPEDYSALAYTYAAYLASKGAIYSETFASTDHAERAGVDPMAYLAALTDGIKRAEADHGIISRLIPTGVRHFGTEAINRAAVIAIEAARDNSFITGFGIAGSEVAGSLLDAKAAFERCGDAGLGLTAHAGEWTGPPTIRDALKLGVTRVGHGIRAAEDEPLMAELAQKGITLEVCPVSNIVLQAVKSQAAHPAKTLYDAGIKLTASSDDPPHFHTNLAKDTDVMVELLGGDERQMRAMLTRNALEAAFVDEPTRQKLLGKLDSALASA
ncbi:MAG: adenosine deaminase [Rhizobiales bacterium]|nr:adenosine deaminase [Hyphomicrobiales bacterium]MBO6699170.1 adenosine deaminase [Hyphomicrobiales bacterium]MBO6736708.1 adenosine deaminase [Hyphomicrobiales bacterium]MBO6912218.1 adenosine deaminase [Hyphomicrobiales bacterium]MBO6956221.1 adenosine deaminase [Hyphomicrobiales bacterium]